MESSGKSCMGHKSCVETEDNKARQFQYTKSLYTIEKGYIEIEKKTQTLGEK